MTINFLAIALFGVSALTGLVVEGIKKILDNTKIKYSSNILAVIVSVTLSLVASVVYLMLNQIAFSGKIAAEIIGLMFLSFLTATVGYDKVIQTVKQFFSYKKNDNNDNGNNGDSTNKE